MPRRVTDWQVRSINEKLLDDIDDVLLLLDSFKSRFASAAHNSETIRSLSTNVPALRFLSFFTRTESLTDHGPFKLGNSSNDGEEKLRDAAAVDRLGTKV